MTRPRSRSSGRLTPLKSSDAFTTFVLDQLEGLGAVVPRAMFGGVGLYCDGVFFGIIAADVLYLKTDEANRTDYQRAGMHPFKPYPDRPTTMQYYAVPVGVLEAGPELVAWARKAVAASRRVPAAKRRRSG
jgi:DNA transformation protein and related proteins